jgi:hypothetical protein
MKCEQLPRIVQVTYGFAIRKRVSGDSAGASGKARTTFENGCRPFREAP